MSTPADKPKASPRRRWRTIAKIALVIIFIAVVLPALQILVPAIAYRDDLLALLNYSDDCHAPCFMGITPGTTTGDEARKILENHRWVASVGDEIEGNFKFA